MVLRTLFFIGMYRVIGVITGICFLARELNSKFFVPIYFSKATLKNILLKPSTAFKLCSNIIY